MSYYKAMLIFSPPVLFHLWIGLLNTAHNTKIPQQKCMVDYDLIKHFFKYEDICVSGFMKASYISTSGQTLCIEFPAAISCRQQYYIIIASTPPPLFQRKEITHLHAQFLDVYFFVWIDIVIEDWTNGWRGYNFIYKRKNWLKARWALYWLKHLHYYLVGFMSASSWKVVSITGNMIGKGQTESLGRCDLWNCSSLNKHCIGQAGWQIYGVWSLQQWLTI